MLPPGSEPEPVNVTEDAGKVIVWSAPAFAVGGVLATGALLTITVTLSVAVAPLSSVTFKLKT